MWTPPLHGGYSSDSQFTHTGDSALHTPWWSCLLPGSESCPQYVPDGSWITYSLSYYCSRCQGGSSPQQNDNLWPQHLLLLEDSLINTLHLIRRSVDTNHTKSPYIASVSLIDFQLTIGHSSGAAFHILFLPWCRRQGLLLSLLTCHFWSIHSHQYPHSSHGNHPTRFHWLPAPHISFHVCFPHRKFHKIL